LHPKRAHLTCCFISTKKVQKSGVKTAKKRLYTPVGVYLQIAKNQKIKFSGFHQFVGYELIYPIW
jgi:hypothetical protein